METRISKASAAFSLSSGNLPSVTLSRPIASGINQDPPSGARNADAHHIKSIPINALSTRPQ